MDFYVMLRCGDGDGVAVSMDQLSKTGALTGLVSFEPPLFDYDLGIGEAHAATDGNGNAIPTILSILLPNLRGSTLSLMMQWLKLSLDAADDPLYHIGITAAETPPFYLPPWAVAFFGPLSPDVKARLAHGAEYLEMPILLDMINKVMANTLHALHDDDQITYIASLTSHIEDTLI